MKRDYRDFLHDIVDDTERVMEFVYGMTYEEFRKDYKTCYAVFIALENIGEAAKKIPIAVRKKYPTIPFKEMAGMRDVLTHEYFGINHKVVWNVVDRKLPQLLTELRIMLRQVEEIENKANTILELD